MEDKDNYSGPDISKTSSEIYFYNAYMNGKQFHSYRSSSSYIRLCIFLITSVCAGLPALVWALRLLYLHVKTRKQISFFIPLLLLSDLIQLLFSLYIVTQLLRILSWSPGLFQVWSGVHWSGFHLHQLVALEGVLMLKYPLCSARIFSHNCNYIIVPLVIIFSVQSAFFTDPFVNTNILLFNIGTSLTFLILFIVTIIIKCKASSSPVSKNTHSVFTLSFFTFVMLFLPFFLFTCVNLFIGELHISWYAMCLCLMSLRVISDPILCVLVCREMPQTDTESNADETSVSSVTGGVFV